MTTTADIASAARLVSWSARPKERPARHDDYRQLVERYLASDDFAEIVDACAAGMGLNITVDPVVGAVTSAEPDSPFRVTPGGLTRQLKHITKKASIATALIGIVRTLYPTTALLDNPHRVPQVSVGAVVDYLNRLCEQLAEDAADSDLDELWRTWLRLRQTRADSQRSSANDRAGLVRKMCNILEAEGLLSHPTNVDGGTWRATQRMRIAAISLAEDADLYAELLATETGTADVDSTRDGTADSEQPDE